MSLPDGRKLSNLRVNELKHELEKRGMIKSGNKKDLVVRLEKAIEDKDSSDLNEESDVKAESENDDERSSPNNPEEDEREVANSEESNEAYQQNESNDGENQAKVEEAAPDFESESEDKSMKVEPDQSENQGTEDMEADTETQPQDDDEQVGEVEDRQEEDEAEAEILQGNVSDDEAITGEIDSSEVRGVPPKDLERFEAENAQTSEVTTSTKIEEGDNDELEEGEMRDDDDEADSSSKGNAEVSQGTTSIQTANTSSVTSTRKRQWGIRRPSAKAYVELSLSSQALNSLVDVTSTSANSEGDLRNESQTHTLSAIAETEKEASNRVTRLVTVEDEEDGEAMEEGEVPATPLSGEPLTGNVLHSKSSIHGDEESSETDAPDQTDSKRQNSMEETKQNVAYVTVEIPHTPISQEADGDAQTKPSSPTKIKKKGLRETRAVGYHVEDPVRGRDVEAPSQSASDTIQIRGLVRPFTLNQLKDLLSRYGNIKKFWIDRVKSKSFIQFQASDEAAAAREGLDGCKWPSINPRLLRVDFSSEEELDWMMENGESGRPFPRVAPPAPRPAQANSDRPGQSESSAPAADKESSSRDRDRHRERPRHKEEGDGERRRRKSGEGSRKTAAPPVREWDRDKVKQSESPPPARRPKRRSRSRSPVAPAPREKTKGAEPKEETKERRKEEAAPTAAAPTPAKEEPARLLDDLFRKTKVLPSIYWLPLNEEQIKQRQREREERAKARQRPKVSPHGPSNKGSSSATGSRQTAPSGRRRSRSRSRSRRRDWDPRRR